MTDDQGDRYRDLQIRKRDHRYNPPRWFSTLEAEAIEQGELTAAVVDALDALEPVSLDDLVADEEAGQAVAARRLRRWQV